MALLKNITSGSIDGIVITGSLEVSNGITGSLFGTASWARNAITASYFSGSVENAISASYALTASYALNGGSGGGGDISGSDFYVAVYSGSNALRTGSIFDSGSFTAIGATAPVDPSNPDRLFVDAGNTTSYNLISGHGEVDSYLQLNIQNFSPGSAGSSDIVATADNGNETDFYIDMGINGSGYNDPAGIGAPNDAYLYNTGGDLLIGNTSSNKRVIIFNGGTPALDNARVYITQEGSVGINASDVNNTNPEALLVEPLSGSAGNDFNNLIIGRGTINENYLQLNIVNKGTGSLASSDIVATNDIGTESDYYIDMGINSSNYSNPNSIGMANDAYLYSTAEHLHIGNASAGMPVMFFAGGFDSEANKKFELWPDNQHQMSGSLNITGSLIVLEGITGSLYGTASWAESTLTASYVNPLRQDVIITGSLLISGSQTLTGSLRLAISDTNTFTFSNTDNVLNYSTSNSSYRRWTATNTSPSGAAAIGFLFYNDLSDLFQFYHGSSNNTSITPRQSMMRASGTGGLRLTADSGPIVFHAGSYGTERARFDTAGRLLIGLTTGSAGYLLEVNSGGRFTNNVLVTGSVTATTGFTGSLFGTASWAQNSINTISAISSSFAATASSADNFLVRGTLTAQTIVAQVITSSTEFVTGSTRFGSSLSNTHEFTGSVSITGSLTVFGNSSLTGSLFGTSSWATNAVESTRPIAVSGSTIYSSDLVATAGPGFNTVDSIILGYLAGNNTQNAYESNFIGPSAGRFSTDAHNSNFLGLSAGYFAPYADNSNFLGNSAGENAYTASSSNFIGYWAGNNARNASYSNFIGDYAGYNAASASFSTFMGRQAGASFNGTIAGSVGRNNIVIGHNITFPAGRQDSINLGAIIFATGSYFSGNYTMFTGSVGNGRVGINQPNPTFNLDVSGSGRYTSGLIVTGSVTATTGFTGSLFGTASWAQNALTASFVPTSSLVGNFFVQGGNSFGAQALLGTNDNQNLAFETSGSIRMFVSSSGNIGIGTSTPISSLQVSGSGAGTNVFVVSPAGAPNVILKADATLTDYSGLYIGNKYIIQSKDAGPVFFNIQDNLTLANGLNARSTMNSSGNLGLGITSAANIAAKLHISGSTSETLLIASSSAGPALFVSGSGNVGIGNANPSVPLEIGRLSGGIQAKLRLWSGGSQYVQLEGQDSILDFNLNGVYSAVLSRNGGQRFTLPSNSVLGWSSAAGTSTPVGANDTTLTRWSAGVVAVGSGSVANASGSLLATSIGIGAFTPSASLHILGASSAALFKIDSPSVNNIIFVSGSGNVGIGTNTPTASLDVSGSARVQQTLTVGSLGANGTINLNRASTGTTVGAIIQQSGATELYNYQGSGFNFYVAGATTPVRAFIRTGGIGITGTEGGSFTLDTGAALQISSSTQGFLNSRMTTAQRNAMSSSQGLMVYVTSSADEGIWYYNSGSYRAWTRVLNDSGSQVITGSLNVTQAVTSSILLVSGSGTQRITVIGSGSAQPIFTVQGSQGELFSITDSLSGSLFSVNDISGLPIVEVFSDNTMLMGSYLAPSLNTTVRATTTNSGSFTIYSVPTASYDGLFMEYTARSGSNARAGQFMAIWSGSSVNFTDNSTTDFGNTSRLAFTGSISGSVMTITGNVTVGSGWTVKSIIRSI